ncbi:unnamed protein product [Calypogeia fissa]
MMIELVKRGGKSWDKGHIQSKTLIPGRRKEKRTLLFFQIRGAGPPSRLSFRSRTEGHGITSRSFFRGQGWRQEPGRQAGRQENRAGPDRGPPVRVASRRRLACWTGLEDLTGLDWTTLLSGWLAAGVECLVGKWALQLMLPLPDSALVPVRAAF